MKHMINSRMRRHEERNARRRIAIAILGSVGIVVFIGVFGLRILIGFSLLVDKIRGSPAQSAQTQSALLPPVLDPLPEATASATITVTGRGEPEATLILFLNDERHAETKITSDGTFVLPDITLPEGDARVYAIVERESRTSSPSDSSVITIDRTQPKLEISEPADGASVHDGTHRVRILGITEPHVRVSINDRIAVVKSDGSFIYSMPINDGENRLIITSRDDAGNETTVTRTVTYIP